MNAEPLDSSDSIQDGTTEPFDPSSNSSDQPDPSDSHSDSDPQSEYEVDEVLDWRGNKGDNTREFLVRWSDDGSTTWTHESQLVDADGTVNAQLESFLDKNWLTDASYEPPDEYPEESL